MNWKRLLRVLVCLVLVCTLMFDVSPIKARAVDPATMTALSFAANSVVASILIGLGFEFVRGGMEEGVELVYDVLDYIAFELQPEYYMNDEILLLRDENGLVYVPQIAIDDIRNYLFSESILEKNYFEGVWSLYGEYSYPTFPDIEGFPYMYLFWYRDHHVLTYTNEPLYWNEAMESCYHPGSPQYYYQINFDSIDFTKWDSYSFYQLPDEPLINERLGIVYSSHVSWSNVDIVSTKSNPNYLYMQGSQPIIAGDFKTSTGVALGHVADQDQLLSIGYPNWSDDSVVVPAENSGLSQNLSYYPVSLGQTLDQTLNHTQNQIWNGLDYSEDIDQDQDLGQDQGVIIGYLKDLLQALKQFPAKLLEGLSNLFVELFVPSSGFIQDKANQLAADYSFVDSISSVGKDLRQFLTTLGSTPPVIRINLGAATGEYSYGGEVVLVDFSFYEPYKPQMDAILSAFLWLWFCWRLVLLLPGILSGNAGVIGTLRDSTDIGRRGYVELTPLALDKQPLAEIFVPESNLGFHLQKDNPASSSNYESWRDQMAKEDKS